MDMQPDNMPQSEGDVASAEIKPAEEKKAAANNPINNNYDGDPAKKEMEFDLAETKSATEPKQDYSVHFMPKDFQDNNVVAGKHGKMNGLIIMAASIIFLALVSFGVYYYLIAPSMTIPDVAVNQPPVQNNATPADHNQLLNTDNLAVSPGATADLAQTPADQAKAVYQEYKVNMALAKTFADYYTVVQNYGSTTLVAKADADKLANKTLAAAKNGMPDFDGTEYLEAEIKGNNIAVIKVTLQGRNGIVMMKQENGLWKVENEDWGQANLAEMNTQDTTQASITVPLGTDTDGDGLTDLEETILGTNSNLVDTDGDSYADAAEVTNLYDPTSNGKLLANTHLTTYNDLGISFLYPTTWVKEVSTDQKLITFKSKDNHMFQIYIVDSTVDLDSYYKQVFSVDTITANARYAKNSWSGIWTTSNRIIYVKAPNNSHVYIVGYNVGSNETAEYKTVYQALINSLTIK
jgi:hypothetical protein